MCFVLPVLIIAARMSIELIAVTRVLKALMLSIELLLVVNEFLKKISSTFCMSLQPLLELGSKSTFLSSGLWMLPKKRDTICRYIACSQILFCPFYLLLQPLLELGSKSTSLSSGFSDVIKAVRYDLLIHCLIS